MRTLCLGDSGSLGREVAKLTTHSAGRMQVDISCRSQVKHILESYRPDVVINCAGIVKGRDVPESAYIMVNALGPWQLRYECERIKAKLIQVSTDCVFSGALKYPATYTERHLPTPIDIYDRSKLLGESGHVTIRTSFVGHGKYGLLAWLTHTQKKIVQGYSNAMWSGLTAPALARVLMAIATNIDSTPSLLHVHGECVSKYALLGMLNKHLNLGLSVEPSEKPVINRCLSSVHSLPFIEVPMLPDMVAML